MNQLFSVCLLGCLLQLTTTLSGDFSLKTFNNWISGYTQETIYHEYEFKPGRTLEIENKTSGTITIKTWARHKIVVNAIVKSKEKTIPDSLSIVINENNASFKTKNELPSSTVIDFELMIPEQTNLVICAGGAVKIKAVDGTINVHAQGAIDIRSAANSIRAQTDQSCSISMHTVPLSSRLYIESSRAVDLIMPTNTHAHLYAKTENGTISSEHYFTFRPFSTKLNQTTWNQMRKEINGHIGNGGAHIEIHSKKGAIKILKNN
jgi:hypothetical protein